jgi:hypothetical protein
MRAIPGFVGAGEALGFVHRDESGDATMGQQDLYAIGQFMPLMAQARRLLPNGDERMERRYWTSLLSWAGGIGLRTNTEDEQLNELTRRRIRLEEELGELEYNRQGLAA